MRETIQDIVEDPGVISGNSVLCKPTIDPTLPQNIHEIKNSTSLENLTFPLSYAII